MYRHPDYSKDFFKEGGLVPNCNYKAKVKKAAEERKLKSVRIPGKLTWKDRVK